MKSANIVSIVLVILVVLSTVQAFQLSSLKSKISDGELAIGSSTSTKPLSSGGSSGSTPAALPSSLDNLPQMVGGC